MAMIDLYNSIYSTLTADQTSGSFYDDVDGRIWLVDGPASDDLPMAIITPITESLGGAFDTSSDDIEFVFQIDVYTSQKNTTVEALIATNEKLIALLDRVSVTVTNWCNGQFKPDPADTRGIPTRDGDAWVINSQWILTATEA